MGNNNPNVSYTINIDTYVRDITKDIKKQKKELVDFKSDVDNMNLGDEISKQIQQVIDELDKMQEKYVTNLKKFADSKLSTESFDKFTKKFNDDMSLISERMTKIESKVYDLSEKFSSVKGVDKLQDKFEKLQNKVDLLDGRIKNLMRDMKDTIKILKDFDSMTTMNNTSKGLKDINKTISKLNKVNVDKKGSSIFENDINKLKDSFVDTYERMTDLQDQLGKEKEPKAIRRLQDELVDTIELLEQTGKAIAEMTDGKSMLKTSASFTRKGFEYHVKDIAEEIVDLQDAESIIAKSLAKSKAGIIEIIEALNKEVTTSAESFKFQKGGIVIPVILDPNSKQFLEDETQKLVKVLNDYAELHPVNVTFRLFPMTGSKADVSSISKSMKEVRAEIEKIEEPELKARFSEFSDKLEKQYQQALKLRIAVEISQTADEVKRDIEKIKEVVKNNGIGSIDLSFDISDKEAEKIKLVYNKKVVGKIQSMANSLNKIFDVKTISGWSEQFRTALGQVSEKLKTMQPLIQPLADLTLSQDIKKKRGRPKKDTLENKNIIDGFTKTMDLLNKSLAERSKAPKLNAEEFTQEIQEAIDKADIPVTVPVEPDTQGFIEQLEDRLKSVPVNVVVGNVIGGAVSGGAGAGIVVTGGNVTMENPTVDESGVKETKSKGGEKSSKQKQDSSSIFGVSKDFIKKEFANVSFDGKNKGVKKTDEEKKLTDAFYELYDSYKELMTSLPKITSGIEKAKERSEKLEREVSLDPLNKEKIKKSEEYNAALPEKLAERMKLLEENRAKIELIEKEFPSFKDSNFNSRRTRENLLKEFLKSKGIERTASLTPKQYLDNLKDEVASKGSLTGKGAKNLINSIVDRFIGFEQLDLEAQMKENDGHSVTELTKNATDEFNKLFTEYSHLANDAGKIGKEIETLRENKGYAYKKKIAEKQTELDAQNAKIDEFVKNNKVFSNVIPNKPLDEQKNKLLKKYINSKNIYKTRGMSITDLTDDSKAKNKLLKAYNKRLGIVDDNKKANEEYADSSEKIARKSMFEGVATEELQKKYTELAKEKEKLSEYTSSDLLTDSTKDKEGIQSIIKSIDWLKKSNKTALDYKKKGLINSEGLSLDEAKKRGFTIQGDEIIDALTQEDISKDIIKGLVEKYGISKDMLKGINRKSKAKVEDLAKEILAHGKRKEMGKNIDNEMRQITTELSLREKEEEARKKAEEEAQKKNKKKKTESKETKIEATSADEASTDSINKESEALENNTNEQEKNNKVKKEKIDIAQQIRDRIAREREEGKIDTTGIPEDTLETALATTIKTAEEKGTGVQSALGVYKYLINFYKESKNAMLEGLQSGQDTGTAQDVKDTQKKINAEKKEAVNYDSMSEEELQKCLATEEKILARCKEGSEAYNRRKQTIEEINTLLSSKKGQTDTTPESDLESKENTFQGLIDRIKKYDEEKVKISELKKIYKEYLDLVDTLPYDGEQGTHVWGTNDDDRDIIEFLAKQLSKNGYKYSEKYDDFVKGNSKFGFDSDTADNISEIINRGSDAIEREANAVKKNNEAIKEKQIEALKKEQDAILETVDAKKRDKISTKELIDTYEKLLAINNAIVKLNGENDLNAAKESGELEDYIELNRGIVLASGQKDNGKKYWYNPESNRKYSSTPYGQKFGEDYIQGILSKVDESEQSGEEIAKATEEGVRKAAKIESPSRVAMALGKWWGIGWKEGLEKSIPEITQAITDIMNASEETLREKGIRGADVSTGILQDALRELYYLPENNQDTKKLKTPLFNVLGVPKNTKDVNEYLEEQNSKYESIDPIYGKITRNRKGYEIIQSDIGLTYDELIEKIKIENEEIEKGNGLFRERSVYFKDGKVIESYLGSEGGVNDSYDFTRNVADRHLHTHPNTKYRNNFSAEDMLAFYFGKHIFGASNLNTEDLITNDASFTLDLTKVSENAFDKITDIYIALSRIANIPFVDEEEYGKVKQIDNNKYISYILKELISEAGGKLSVEGIDYSDINKELAQRILEVSKNAAEKIKNKISEEVIIHEAFQELSDVKQSSKSQVKQKQFLSKENAEKKFKSAYDKYFKLRDKTKDSDEEVKAKATEDLNKLLIQYPTLNSIGKKKKENVDYDKQLKSFLDTQTQLRKETDKATESTDKNTKSEQKNKQAKKENQKATEDLSKSESKKTVQVDRYLNKDNATKAFEDAYNKYFDLRDKTDEKSVNSKNKLLERFPTLKDIGNKNKDEVKYADELNKFLQTQTKLKEANAKATDKQADAVKAETEEVRKNTEEKKKNNAEEKKNDSSVADTSSQIKSSSGEFDKEKSGVTRTIKGVITRLNNSDELSKEQLDKADSTFAKWINKAKELGMDVSKFEQDFSSARAKFGESVEDSLGKIEEETRVEIKSLDDRRKEYLNLLKDVGKKYLGEENVDMVQQTRIKETKEGQFKAISYKVSGKSGSVTLDPNGQVIATRKPVSDDYSRRQETVNTLVKEQDTLLKDILKKEKQIGVARADGFDSLAETLSKQVEEKQKLYDENKQSLKEMGEEETLQQQLIKEVTVRKKQEEEINEIISRRNDKARKAEEAKAEKDRQKLDKQVKDYVDKIEKQNLSLDDQALAQITNANVGVSKPEGYYDYKKYTEGDKWVGALTGADDLINKYKELLQAEKKLDEVTKNYEKAPRAYAQALQDAKDNVSALTGEMRDLVKVTSLDSLSSDQMAKWTEIDEAMEEVRRKRDAKVEEKSNKEITEAEKQKSKEVNKLLNDRLATYREIYNIADQIRKLDGVENFDQISELIKQQKEKRLSIYDTNEKIRKLDPNAVLDSENIEKMKKIRKDYHDKLYAGNGKESDDARRMRSIKEYSELNEKVKKYIKLKKDIANGKGLEGDVEQAENLYRDIQNVTKALSNSNLFNEKLEAKATKGLSTIDEEVNRIQKQKAKKNYEKKQKDDELEKQKKINNLLDDREKAYKKIWDYAVEIAKLDPDKNAKEIQDVNYKQNVQQQIFDNITRKLSVGDITDAHKEKLRQISTDAYDKMDKNIARAEDDNLIKKSAKAYSSLGDMVREYISLKKEIARGKGLAGDDAEAKQLKKDIDDLNNLLIGSSLYNGDFEEKAMKGFSTIDAEVARIEAKLQDANQKKLYQKFTDQKGRLESAKYDLQFEIDNGNHTDAFVQDLKQKILDIDAVINDINTKPIDVVTQADINNASDLLERVRQIRKEGNLTANKKANENSLKKNLTQVNSILSENTKMSFRNSSLYREFSELQNIFKTFDTSRPQEELARLTTRMLKAKAEFEELDDSFKGKGFFGLFAERLRGINAQFLAQYFSWQDFIRYGRTAISTIIDLDTQLVDLRKTTKMNNEELEEFYYNANQVAKRMGVTTSEIISQAAAWSRLGFNTKEASTQMAEISSKFASISPGMTTENATDYLVSTIQAYGLKTEEVERTVLDNVNAVGNAFATTNAEIGEMLTRSSAAMKEANNTLEETIALETAAVEVTRNAERTGTAFRTVSMRIRGYDEEGEDGELLEDYEELKGKIADLTKTAKTPGGISLFTDETKQTYKSTYQLLKEISEIYHDLTDKDQAALLEALAGKRGGQVLAPILSDFKQVDKAMETMENAAGSADKEMGIIRDSLEFKINEIKQTWVGVLQNITDRGGLGKLLDSLNSISSVLGDIVSKTGLLKTALISIGAIWGSKNLGIFNTKNDNTILGSIFQSRQNKRNYEADSAMYNLVKTDIGIMQSKGKSDWFLDYDLSKYDTMSDRVREKLSGIQEELKKTGGTGEDAIAKINEAMENTTQETTALGNSIKGFFKGLLNGLVSGVIVWGITTAVNSIAKTIDKALNPSKYIQKAAKKAREEIANIKSELKSTTDVVDEVKMRYAQLAQEVKNVGTIAQSQGTLSDDEYKEFLDISNQLAEVFPTLTRGYDENGKAIVNLSGDVDTIVSSLEHLVDVEKQVANANISKQLPKDWAGYVDSLKNANKDAEGLKYIIGEIENIRGKRQISTTNSIGLVDKALEIAQIKSKTRSSIIDKAEDHGDTRSYDLSELSIDEYNAFQNALATLSNQYSRQLDQTESTMKSQTVDFYNNILSLFSEDSFYKGLSDTEQKIFQGLLMTYDFDSLAQSTGDNWEAAFAQIQYDLISKFNNVSPEDKGLIEEYYNEIFSIDTSEGVFAENIEKIKEYINKLAELLGVDQIDLMNIFGLGDIDTKLNKAKGAWKTKSDYSSKDIENVLKNYSVGGNVDLTNRPKVDSSYMRKAGWTDVNGGYATVYTGTYNNEEGTRYLNFTPIIVDPKTGEFKGVLTPDELSEYAEGVIAGTRTDDLNLQIGAEFNTVEAAEAAAEAIHKYSELITSEDYSSEGEMGYMTIDPRKITEEQNLRKEYEKFIDSLEESDLDIWNAALNNGKIDPEILRSGEEGLREYLKELQKIAEDNAIKPISAVDTVDAMADMKSAVASLGDLWNQTVQNQIKLGKDKKYLNENGEVEKQIDENGQAIGFADPELINNVEQAFKKFIETSDKAGKDITEMNFALEEFERIMIEQPGDVDAARSAIDNLITSYIDQTDIIKKLDESNKEWAKAQLEAMGITNADAVVEARLSKKTKELMANITKLAKAYDKLADAEEGSKEYADAISGIAVELESMLDLDDIEINEEFVVKNLDLIRQAASGSAEAINQLRKEAAKEIVAQIHIEGNTQEIMGYQDYINNLIDNFDIEDVEVGAVLHDNAMIDGLNNLVDAGIITRDSMNNILSGIGVEPRQTKGIDVDIEAYNQAKAMGLTGQALTEATKALKARIRVPGIEYHVVSKGTGAKYSAPSGGGSSSGGGGGGGGGSEPTQPKEEAEESFDWIEVAIQRIEEQITRLDKVVGNSYTLWSNRNKAIADELDEITKKIEAEGIAQQEYLRNADKVQVNNGKGLNDDDYGENDELVKARDQELLDAAKKAWATGEYQRKVREGQMSGDDIEKIQNHFLADTIKEYQELYNKAVQAGDAVYDAMLERAGKYEERFNMVKDEYAELIQYVTDAADVIDEKINRTEKHGYFVSKSYYEQLKELEAQHGTYLQNEYNELVKKRDEAVSSGAIEEGSSAWNKMNQEINSVNLELEQHLTKMVEYNNTIRQLDWDFFDWVEERISRINDEASFLVDLMSNDKLYEDNGFLNNLGHATNAMYAAQYEVYMRQAKDYADERLKLEKEIAKDPANKDLIARYEELVDAQQDAIKGAEQMKDSVKSLVQEGINLYLQSLQKLIDKYKESLSDAKDLYSYQQNIAEQTKNIGNLRKQLTAYEGDDSEETRATVQRLRTQLEDAEKKLKETEWDKYISETESFLSDMYTDMEETLNARLDDIDLLMHDMIDVANENSATVQDTIRTETDKVGYTLTSYFDGIVNGGGVLATDLNNGFTQISGLMTNVLSVIEQIKNYAATMVDNGKTKVESTKTTTVNTNTPTAPKATGNTTTTTSNNKPATNTTNNNNKPATNTTNNNKPARSETDYYGVALAIINGNYGWGNGDNRVSRLKQKGFDATKVQDLVNKIWNEGYIFSGAWVGRYQGITDLSKYSYNKYAKGSKRISHDQMAITQEKGAEMIFRNDDGSLLMPLGTGDKVFTAQMTDNLWELAKGKFTTNIPKTGGGNTINNSNAINITLPNVTNYEQFKTQLQNDPKMTSFIQQITLGEVSNGVKLNKKKY